MQYKVTIDVSPYVSELYNRYEGDLTKKTMVEKRESQSKGNRIC